jgi:hypothetical protein
MILEETLLQVVTATHGVLVLASAIVYESAIVRAGRPSIITVLFEVIMSTDFPWMHIVFAPLFRRDACGIG